MIEVDVEEVQVCETIEAVSDEILLQVLAPTPSYLQWCNIGV